MTKVVARLNARREAILRRCPGQTDGARLEWLVDYFGQVLEARAEKAREAARPRLRAAAADEAGEVLAEVEKTPLATMRVLASTAHHQQGETSDSEAAA